MPQTLDGWLPAFLHSDGESAFHPLQRCQPILGQMRNNFYADHQCVS